MLRVGQISAADLEQANGGGAAIEVAPGRGDETRYERRPHDLHVLADRIGEAPVPAAKHRRLTVGNEAPGHGFIEAARGGCTPSSPLDQLRTCGCSLRYSGRTIERNRRHVLVTGDARDLL